MNHTTKEPKSLQLAVELDYRREYEAAHELRTMQARILDLEAQLCATGAGGVEPLRKTDTAAQALEQGEQVAPYTCDVPRIMREAGMTFHLGLPHKAVVEQMTRVVDLVYAEASIKAAVAFAAPQQEPVAWMYEWNGRTHITTADQRPIEHAHPHFNKSKPLYTAPQLT